MQSSIQKAHEDLEKSTNVVSVSATTVEVSAENVVEFVARTRIIARKCEEAFDLPGNNSSADFDVFEEKYGFKCFA